MTDHGPTGMSGFQNIAKQDPGFLKKNEKKEDLMQIHCELALSRHSGIGQKNLTKFVRIHFKI